MRNIYFLILLVWTLLVASSSEGNFNSYWDSVASPRLLKCSKRLRVLSKRTDKKFLVSSMFKDEEGYLAEFLSFYKVHGFDRVLLWNHGSTDDFMDEIYPWLIDGFVDVKNATEAHKTLVHRVEHSHNKFIRVMIMKRELERMSIMYGIRNGFHYYLSADLDEYVLPTFDASGMTLTKPIPYVTAADAIDEIFEGIDAIRNLTRPWKPKLYMPILKYNYPGLVHTLEPVNQLIIEAYLTRFSKVKYMNFYSSVQAKFVYKLTGSEWGLGEPSTVRMPDGNVFNEAMNLSFTNTHTFLSNCCFFHGCEFNMRNKNSMCSQLEHAINLTTTFEVSPFKQKHAVYGLRMNHYARSLEKFAVKAKTWETSGHISHDDYSIKEHLNRGFGWDYDPVALMYACDVRKEISRARALVAPSTDASGSYVTNSGSRVSARPGKFDFLRFSGKSKWQLSRQYHGPASHHGTNYSDTGDLNDGLFLDYYDL